MLIVKKLRQLAKLNTCLLLVAVGCSDFINFVTTLCCAFIYLIWPSLLLIGNR